MTRSPREVVDDVLDIWSRGDPLPTELLDPEIEWVNPGDAVEAGTRRGREGHETAEANFSESFSSIRFELERMVEDGDSVAAAVRCFSVARGSGLEVERVLGFAWTIRDGRVCRFEWSNDPDSLLPS